MISYKMKGRYGVADFLTSYSLGEGPVAFQYSAEVFPTIQREQGMAFVVCVNNTFGTSHTLSWQPQTDLQPEFWD